MVSSENIEMRGKVSELKGEDSKENSEAHPSLRTLAYTLSVGLVFFWIITLNSVMIEHEQSSDYISRDNLFFLGTVNHLLGILVVSTLIPLSITVPPMFRMKRVRLSVSLCLNLAAALCTCAYITSGLSYLVLASSSLLITNLPALVCQNMVAFFLLFALATQTWVEWTKWKREDEEVNHPVTGRNQSLFHASQVLLVFGSGLMASLENGISRTSTSGSSGEAFTIVLLVSVLLVAVQLHHYTRNHGAWLTRRATCDRMEQFVKEFLLTDLERELLHEKKLTVRLIEGTLTAKIYPRGLCPC